MHQSNLHFDLLNPVTCTCGAKIPFSLQSSHTMVALQIYFDSWIGVV